MMVLNYWTSEVLKQAVIRRMADIDRYYCYTSTGAPARRAQLSCVAPAGLPSPSVGMTVGQDPTADSCASNAYLEDCC